MITIRPYNSDDIAALIELMSDLGYPTTVDKMKNRMEMIENVPLSFTFVALVEGAVAGMMGIRQVYYYEEDGRATQISLLVTKREHHGQGVGKALIHFAEEWAKANQSTSLYLTSGIKPERMKSHEFYKSRGFDVNGYRFVKKLED